MTELHLHATKQSREISYFSKYDMLLHKTILNRMNIGINHLLTIIRGIDMMYCGIFINFFDRCNRSNLVHSMYINNCDSISSTGYKAEQVSFYYFIL